MDFLDKFFDTGGFFSCELYTPFTYVFPNVFSAVKCSIACNAIFLSLDWALLGELVLFGKLRLYVNVASGKLLICAFAAHLVDVYSKIVDFLCLL